ncbi:MAG: hypothetical protein ACLP81_00840, partial [Acidimicrobiales bacterium]
EGALALSGSSHEQIEARAATNREHRSRLLPAQTEEFPTSQLGSARPGQDLRARHLLQGLDAVRRLAAGGQAENPSPLGGFRSVQASRGRQTTVPVQPTVSFRRRGTAIRASLNADRRARR